MVVPLAIRTLRARTPVGAQPVAARLALQALGADLEDALPRSLPPQALLWLRRLRLQTPEAALRRPAPPAWRQDWIAAGRQALDAALAHAARPALGPVPADAEAVLFADEAEMLACLALAARTGQLDCWWWRGLLGHSWPRWEAAWAARPQAQQAARRLLQRAGQGGPGLLAVLDAAAEGASWGAPPAADGPSAAMDSLQWPTARAATDAPGAGMQSGSPAMATAWHAGVRADASAGVAMDSPQARAPAEGAGQKLESSVQAVPRRATLPQAPGSGGVALSPEVRGDEAVFATRQPRPPAVLPAASQVPGTGALTSAPAPHDGAPDAAPADATEARHADARAAAEESTTAPVPQPLAAAARVVAAAHGDLPASLPRATPDAPGSLVAAVPLDVAEPDAAPDAWPWPQALLSQQAPLLFVVNALLEDGLYPDFTRPRDPGLPVPLWALLAALAAAWRLPPDPLHGALGEHAGDWTLPATLPAVPGVSAGPWASWLPAFARTLRRRLCRRLGLRVAQWPRALTQSHPARLWVSEAEWVAEFDLSGHDVAWRLAGLDRDAGWLPSVGCSLRFRFV